MCLNTAVIFIVNNNCKNAVYIVTKCNEYPYKVLHRYQQLEKKSFLLSLI